jgi:HPt (histidine-containing phosphotransfer) domain-containing protein
MVSMVASVVDTAEAIRQLGGDAQAYVEVCQVFLQESLAWEADLPLLAAQDRLRFVAMLHELTNALPVVGAGVLARSLRKMEFELRDKPGVAAEPALQAAMQGLVAVTEALRAEIAVRGR